MNTVSILIQQSSDLDNQIEEIEIKVAKLKAKRPTKRRLIKIKKFEDYILSLKHERQNTAIRIICYGRVDKCILDNLK